MAAAAAGHGFFYPSMWGSSHPGSFGNSTSSNGGGATHSTTSQLPNISPTSNAKENCDTNSFEHASPPNSATSSSPAYGYPSSPSKCDVKSAHSIKIEHNLSSRNEGETHPHQKSLATTANAEYNSRSEASPSGGFSPTNNNNHLNSEKDDLPAAPSTESGGYENLNRHHSYHYHQQDTGPSTYNGHTISGNGNSSSGGHLMKRPEGTNRTNTTEKGENRDNPDDGSFSPTPDRLQPPVLCNSSSISSVGAAYPYLGSAHQSSPHQISSSSSSLSSPLYGSYSTCGSIFASSKTFQSSSSSSKSRSIKSKANSSGKTLKCAI